MKQKYLNKDYPLYIDSRCTKFECESEHRTLFGLKIPYSRPGGNISFSCPTCDKDQKDIISYELLNSDFDEIEYDVEKGMYICPLNGINPCNVHCPHYTKPHLDSKNAIIVLRFCGLSMTS